MMSRSRGAIQLALLLVLALFLALPGVVLAQGDDESSNHALPILRMGVGTRTLAMGGAGTAASMDATAGYWNPAGLGWTCGTQISAMHALGMEADRRMSFVAASHRFDWGALGASFLTAGMSDIDGRDEAGQHTEMFSYGDLGLMLHGAYSADLGELGLMSLGGTFKYLRETIDVAVPGDDAATGFGFDIGVGVQPLEWMRMGVTLKDFATEVGDADNANKVPMNLRGGVALMPIQGFTFAFDLNHTEDENDMKYHAGAEFAFPLSEDFGGAMRLGLNDGSLTAGLGLAVKMVEFNYAFIEEPEEFLGESHRLGVTLRFDEEECPFDLRPHEGFKRSKTKDRDMDGIPDAIDACPTAAEDFDGFEDTDGCPDVDNDGDGILDVNDNCPDRAEDFDGFEDADGCPEVDNDGDGILDTDDKCPNAAETFNRFEDTDGCPDEAPLELPMAYINFKTGSAEISGADPVPILEDVARIMKKYPEMKITVVGHTDNVGDDGYNMTLSKRRAEAVKAYIANLGISADRLLTEGKGKLEPIATNDTSQGRTRNRRIEFKVMK